MDVRKCVLRTLKVEEDEKKKKRRLPVSARSAQRNRTVIAMYTRSYDNAAPARRNVINSNTARAHEARTRSLRRRAKRPDRVGAARPNREMY